ncbi:TRAP transporter small permease [Bacillus sp. JCM 19041]|uniref:TRAP transporter small permease n=1 Tax=Bacillus sp. JCM 19041 TaxID=1460637 RepID=UPI0006D04C6B
MKWVATADAFLHRFIRILHGVSNVALCVMIVCVTIDVAGRFFFNRPLVGSFEATELGLAILVFFSLSMTHLYEEHISIDFFVTKLPNRIQHFIQLIIESALFFVLIIMIFQTISYGTRLYERGTTTSDLLLPVYPFLYCIAFAAFVFALLALSNICKSIYKAVNAK